MWVEVLALVGCTVAAALLVVLYRMKLTLPVRQAPDTPRSGNPKDEIILFTFPRLPDSDFSPSPFASKLEAFLRLSGIPFKTRPADLSKAPKGKVPYIQHGPHLIGDSTLIIRYLLATYSRPHQPYFGKLRLSLSPYETSIGHMVQALCENSIYNCILWARWLCRDDAYVKRRFFGEVPFPIRGLICSLVRRGMYDWLWGQGFIRQSPNDLITLSKLDIDAVDTLLANKSFLFGDAPSVYDCALYAFMQMFVKSDIDLEGMRTYVSSKGRIVNYVHRMHALVSSQ